MTTVGFGDYYPVSTLGRILAVVSGFAGTFLVSLMVSALSLTVEFNLQEQKAYDSIKNVNFELDYGRTAVTVLQRSMRYYWHVKAATDDSYRKSLCNSPPRKSLTKMGVRVNFMDFLMAF